MGWLGWNWVRGVAPRLGELGVGVGRAAAPVHTHPRPSAGQTTTPFDGVHEGTHGSIDRRVHVAHRLLDHDPVRPCLETDTHGMTRVFCRMRLMDEPDRARDHVRGTAQSGFELLIHISAQCRRQGDTMTADRQIDRHLLISSMIPGRKESSAHTGWGRSYGMETHRARATIPSLCLRCARYQCSKNHSDVRGAPPPFPVLS